MPGFTLSIPKQNQKEVLLGQLGAAKAAAEFRDETADTRAMDDLAAKIDIGPLTQEKQAAVDRWVEAVQ